MTRRGLVLPVPHLLQELLHADLLALHLHHPRVLEHAPGGGAAGGVFLEAREADLVSFRKGSAVLAFTFEREEKMGWEREREEHVPAFDKVLEIGAPFDLRLVATRWLIFQLRQRLPHDILDNIDQARPRLHVGAVGGEGEAVLRDLEKGDAQRPDVGGDGIGLPGDALGRHVVGRADKGVGVAAGAELAADAEVAELDLAIAAEKDVGGLDVWG